MTARAQELLREALTLPVKERADVAAELLASLDDAPPTDQAEVEAAWAREIERRARHVMTTGRFRPEPEASAELEHAALWYESQRPGLGLEFVQAVVWAVWRGDRNFSDGPQLPVAA